MSTMLMNRRVTLSEAALTLSLLTGPQFILIGPASERGGPLFRN